jgi:hypothetical protein
MRYLLFPGAPALTLCISSLAGANTTTLVLQAIAAGALTGGAVFCLLYAIHRLICRLLHQ